MINRIKEFRKQNHWSQSQFAKKFNTYCQNKDLTIKPITHFVISKWEGGKKYGC